MKLGGVFMAFRGLGYNGENCVQEVSNKGAAATVYEYKGSDDPRIIKTELPRQILALLATKFYGAG